jgi:hypothetical protein
MRRDDGPALVLPEASLVRRYAKGLRIIVRIFFGGHSLARRVKYGDAAGGI